MFPNELIQLRNRKSYFAVLNKSRQLFYFNLASVFCLVMTMTMLILKNSDDTRGPVVLTGLIIKRQTTTMAIVMMSLAAWDDRNICKVRKIEAIITLQWLKWMKMTSTYLHKK